MSDCRCTAEKKISISISQINGTCAIGEIAGKNCIENSNIPVLSCEGACIRGEIARLAANKVSKHGNFKRGCHGELFTVPGSKIAEWIMSAQNVVCIDGCYLKCHSRILENLLAPSKLISFDAFSFHKKYNDLFDIDSVSEKERKETGDSVAQWVIQSIEANEIPSTEHICCC